MKFGRLVSWNENKGYGLIVLSLKEKYFLHCSQISEIPDDLLVPPIGSIVYFDVAPARGKGLFSQAVNARVVPPSETPAVGEVADV